MQNYYTAATGERVPTLPQRSYTSDKIMMQRLPEETSSTMWTTGRTNAEQRQEVADSFARITETAVIVRDRDRRTRFIVEFVTTHKVVPV